MGSIFDTWNDVVAHGGAYYPGAGGGRGAELTWVLISIVMCLAALWVGGRHENDAYRRAGADNLEP